MRDHFANATYGVLDYAAYPIGMLLVAPIVLRHLGAAEYGIWTVAMAAVSTGGVIASGFGDANLQHVAKHRSAGNSAGLVNVVRSMMGINLILGCVFALVGLVLAPYAARHIAGPDFAHQRICLISLRIASVLMLMRAIETVSISTLRAFERYGEAVRVSIGVRLLSLAGAALLAFMGYNTSSIMMATVALTTAGTWWQIIHLQSFLKTSILWPAFDGAATKALFGFGVFSWIQTVSGVLFSQVDRLIIGVSFGAVAVASYALCVQLAQPIFGLTAAGLHFLFPYLSGRIGILSTAQLRRTLLRAFGCNLLFVAGCAVVLLVFGDRVLRLWAGAAMEHNAAPIFPVIVIGSALLGLSVTGSYALLALGRVHTVAWISLAGGAGMLLLMFWFTKRTGIAGLATARLFYGASLLLIYVPLIRTLRHGATAATSPTMFELQEASRS
jgi:O-antigen/teichoic acid export membrane protein